MKYLMLWGLALLALAFPAQAQPSFPRPQFGSVTIGPVPGCWGDGTHDDTACMQAAITAAAGKTLELGAFSYRILAPGLTLANPIMINGPGGSGGGALSTTCNHGFIAGAPNINLVTITGSGTQLNNVCFQMGASAATNTSGAAITVSIARQVSLNNVQVNFPFVGMDITGSTVAQLVDTTVNQGIVLGVADGGAAIRLGNASLGERTRNVRIINSRLAAIAPNTATGIQVLDANGLTVIGTATGSFNTGVLVSPGNGQAVTATTFAESVLGNGSLTNDAVITTGHATGAINGLSFVGTSSLNTVGGASVLISAGSGGTIQTVSFNGHRAWNSSSHGLDIEAGSDIQVNGGSYCGNAGAGVKVGATVPRVLIAGANLGDCAPTGTSAQAISITGNNAEVQINNNILSGATTGLVISGTGTNLQLTSNSFSANGTDITWTPAGEVATVANNNGIDNVSPTVASAASIALPPNPTVLISGTTTVTTITGRWTSRPVRLIATNAAGFAITGGAGSACTNVTLAQNAAVDLVWNAGLGCWTAS